MLQQKKALAKRMEQAVNWRGKFRHEELAGEIRQRILAGDYPPGMQFPPHKQLIKEYRVSELTIRQTVATLVAEGFLHTVRGRGTFVADAPPRHVNYLGVIAPFHPDHAAAWTPFYAGLREEALSLEHSPWPYRAAIYMAIRAELEDAGYAKAFHDLQAEKFAGLIFLTTPIQFLNSALLQTTLPRVAITPLPRYANIPAAVWIDTRSFIRKAIDHLVARGRRRIALMTLGNADYLELFQDELLMRGLECRPYWMHPIESQSNHLGIRNLMHLLFREQPDRPDGLIIADDTLMDPCLAGVMASGIQVYDEVDVVLHTNFPHVAPCPLPVARLGFDTRELFHQCLEAIDAQRRGVPVLPITHVPAIFAEELLTR